MYIPRSMGDIYRKGSLEVTLWHLIYGSLELSKVIIELDM